MKRLLCLVMLIFLAALPVCALAGCQCVQPNEYQIGFDEATCTEPGYFVLKCADCGGVWKEKAKDKLGHDTWQSGFEEATCTEPGYFVLECARCHKEWKEKAKDKLGHDYQYAQTSNATCEKDGKEWYDCTRCGDTQYQTIPKLGHDYKVTSTVDATCAKDGKIVYTCSRLGCGSQKSETIAATGKHRWMKDATEEPDCGVKGTQYYYCLMCGDQKNESIPALEHDWKQVGVKTPTCGEKGAYYLKCSNCDREKTEERAATGEHNWEQVGVLTPTCDQKGAYYLECSTCGKEKTEERAATGHNWKDGQVIKAATCTEDGKVSSACTTCGATDNARVIKATGHSYGSATVTKKATCTTAGESQQTCKTCGDVKKTTIKATGHSWGEWTVTKEATEKAEGKREHTCKDCNQKETQTIPKKAKPTPTPKPTKTPKPTATPKYFSMQEDGQITIISTSGKVNLRTGPGKKNNTAGQVDKKNTNLGELLDAQVDSTGNVWFKVHYKKKNVWISSDYAYALIGDVTNSDVRYVGADSEDLSDICFTFISQAAEHYGIEIDMSGEASNDALTIGGAGDFVEYIILSGEGYALYGIEVGDKLKTVENAMKKNGLYCASKVGGTYVYKRPCQPYSMCVTEEGFDSYIEVVFDSNKCVESISWNAYIDVYSE